MTTISNISSAAAIPKGMTVKFQNVVLSFPHGSLNTPGGTIVQFEIKYPDGTIEQFGKVVNHPDGSGEFHNVAATDHFHKIYKRNQFVRYLYNYNILYRCAWVITDLIYAREAIGAKLIEKN